MCTIVHNNYEKISDTVFWLNKDWILKFVVELNKYNEKRGKENFHKEFGYTKKGEEAINIVRDFNYYLLFESTFKDSNNMKDNIMVTIYDIYFLKFKLNNAVKWFTQQQIFAKKDGRIFIPSKTYNERIDLVTKRYIELEPSVIEYNGEQIIGVRFYMGNDAINFFMDVNRFLSFNYFIETFNMYLAAQGLLSYIGRPEYGTNYIGFDSPQKQQHKFLK